MHWGTNWLWWSTAHYTETHRHTDIHKERHFNAFCLCLLCNHCLFLSQSISICLCLFWHNVLCCSVSEVIINLMFRGDKEGREGERERGGERERERDGVSTIGMHNKESTESRMSIQLEVLPPWISKYGPKSRHSETVSAFRSCVYLQHTISLRFFCLSFKVNPQFPCHPKCNGLKL